MEVSEDCGIKLKVQVPLLFGGESSAAGTMKTITIGSLFQNTFKPSFLNFIFLNY